MQFLHFQCTWTPLFHQHKRKREFEKKIVVLLHCALVVHQWDREIYGIHCLVSITTTFFSLPLFRVNNAFLIWKKNTRVFTSPKLLSRFQMRCIFVFSASDSIFIFILKNKIQFWRAERKLFSSELRSRWKEIVV